MSAAAFVGPLLWAAGDLRPRERRRDSFFSDRAGGAMGLFKLPQLKQDLSTPFIKRTLSNANLESLRACMTDAHGPSLPAFVKHDGMTAADEVIEQQSYPMLVWILGIAALCLLLMLFVAHAALHKRWQIERRVAELCKEDSSTYFAYDRRLKEACLQWRRASRRARRKLNNLSWAVDHMLKRQLSQGLASWIEMAETRAEVMRKLRFGISFVTSRKLALGFASWSESSHAASTQNTKQAMSRAVRQMMNRKLSRCWLAWLAAQQDERWRLESMRRSSSYLANGELAKLSRAHSTWATVTAHDLQESKHVRRALQYWVQQQLASAWVTWLVMHQDQAEILDSIEWAVGHLLHRQLSKGFASFIRMASEGKPLRQKLVRGVSFMTKRSLALGFAGWRHGAAQQMLQAEIADHMTHALRYLIEHKLAIGWVAWRDAHREMTHRIESLQWAVDHMLKRQLSQGLASWIEMAETRAEVMRKLRFGGA